MPRTVSTWTGSALWDAQARASSASPKPKWSAAPVSTSGSAWSALIVLRT
jgi:hypothetical protein